MHASTTRTPRPSASRRGRRYAIAVACVGALALGTVGFGSTAAFAKSTPTVGVAKVKGVGKVLVDSKGKTLYTLTNGGTAVACSADVRRVLAAAHVVEHPEGREGRRRPRRRRQAGHGRRPARLSLHGRHQEGSGRRRGHQQLRWRLARRDDRRAGEQQLGLRLVVVGPRRATTATDRPRGRRGTRRSRRTTSPSSSSPRRCRARPRA